MDFSANIREESRLFSDALSQRSVAVIIREGDDGLHGESPDGLGDGHRAHSTRAAAREREDIGAAAALAIQVDAANDRREHVHERCRSSGILGEDGSLLAVPRVAHRSVDLRDVLEGSDRNQRTELLLAEGPHQRCHGVENGRREQGARKAAAAGLRVDKLGALLYGIRDKTLQILRLRGLWQGRDVDTALPWQANLQCVDLGHELLHEGVCDIHMRHHQLASGAPLAVVVQAPEQDLSSGHVKVCIRKHDGDVLALQLGEDLQAVWFGMLHDQSIGGLGAADEAEAIHEASLHDGAHRLAARARHEVHHTCRQRLLQGVHRQDVCQAANRRQLQHDDVAHEQGGDHHRVHLVQWVVERREHHGNANWPSAHTTPDTVHRRPLSKGLLLIALLQGLDD
mmetsp:Transcript_81114/g.213945  ORF Transcript_81114/g.213945 Transcript_81114/m.213945 type:complete len:398 (+) Transcript_81114:454-1647(+)